jgi:hypothetical protein
MAHPFVPPTLNAKAFNCPLCQAYAQQIWQDILRTKGLHYAPDNIPDFHASYCTHCHEWLYWHEGRIIVPDVISAPPPNDDLNDEIKHDYTEAASIVMKSARGAAALLRLSIQKLCKQLGEEGKNIDKDIGSLVGKGLDIRVQKALDTVRVIGNESVHPGEMDLRDDIEAAFMLFTLVNAIADQMITQPKLRDALYSMLPQTKLDAIDDRDKRVRAAAQAKKV